ncbi:RDD family protein [Chryseobacterium wangxinyae]|uniref:RDD family protein n=1 Tax=Chryseobacterium sp. CY350 TaxID=2997336 RepID=UPI00226F331C|nr:RDD family protein [Chryseobacterium sp. CY350]MCY0978981.1 RDD family protein [Chryseobacterium sp. CY350]WBZ97291.1 RDD family protein [Chryseobacterium sp. CY350]
MRKYLQIIDRNRATKWTRVGNNVIDRIVFNLLFFAIGLLGGIVDSIFEMYYFTKYFEQLANLGKVADIFITSILFFFYIFILEYLTKGRSIGKFATGTKVIMIDGTAPTAKDYFIRNICRLVPFDALSFLGENGWHDSWSDTRVINTKNYEAEKQVKIDIENLGSKEIA